MLMSVLTIGNLVVSLFGWICKIMVSLRKKNVISIIWYVVELIFYVVIDIYPCWSFLMMSIILKFF